LYPLYSYTLILEYQKNILNPYFVAVNLGETVPLTCSLFGEQSDKNPVWIVNKNTLLEDNIRIRYNFMVINNITLRNSGDYNCLGLKKKRIKKKTKFLAYFFGYSAIKVFGNYRVHVSVSLHGFQHNAILKKNSQIQPPQSLLA